MNTTGISRNDFNKLHSIMSRICSQVAGSPQNLEDPKSAGKDESWETLLKEALQTAAISSDKNNIFGTVADRDHDQPNISLFSTLKSIAKFGLSYTPFFKSQDINSKEKLIDDLLKRQKSASNYSEWFKTSYDLDILLNNEEWKKIDESNLYDYKLILNRLNQLRSARLSKNYKLMINLIRTSLIRNLGDMGNINLYRHSLTGTKKLIEDYISECEISLETLLNINNNDNDKKDANIDDGYLLMLLIQTRKSFGRTALVLSGGGCFGLFHIGVLIALMETNLLPRIVSGSSAGSIVAAIFCAKTNQEIIPLLDDIFKETFYIFSEPKNESSNTDTNESFLKDLTHFLKYGTWFDNKGLKQTMINFIGDLTFKEAYYRTGRILNITVSPASVHETPRLLNYLTAPDVLIWSAVCASCSLPGVFESSIIWEKNATTDVLSEWNHESVKFVDGSVDNDLPITRISEMFNVNYTIACQVNPHIVPFLKMSVQCVGGEEEYEYSAKLKNLMSKIYELSSTEIIHILEMFSNFSYFNNFQQNIILKLKSMLIQNYSGDITILPNMNSILIEFDKLLANPDPEFLMNSTIRGARATWPKIGLIRNHCAIELALDRSITILRTRMISNNTKLSKSISIYKTPKLKSSSKNLQRNVAINVNSNDEDLESLSNIYHNDNERKRHSINLSSLSLNTRKSIHEFNFNDEQQQNNYNETDVDNCSESVKPIRLVRSHSSTLFKTYKSKNGSNSSLNLNNLKKINKNNKQSNTRMKRSKSNLEQHEFMYNYNNDDNTNKYNTNIKILKPNNYKRQPTISISIGN